MYNERQFVLLQLYNAIQSDIVDYDTVDDMLGSIHLVLRRHGEREGRLEPKKVFQLCKSDSVCVLLHVIPAHDTVSLLHKTVPYKAGLIRAFGDQDTWCI